jgi:hypothetical protein
MQKQIGNEIAKLTKDPAFVNFVHEQVNKKFDRQYEVLIDDLKKNSTWSDKLNNKNINNGLSAFKNLNGASYFPHIFIPKFQHDSDEGLNNSTSNIVEDDIVFAFYGGSGDSISGSHPAYYLDEDSLKYYGLVNETFADNNEVWVFALNESLDADGKLALPCGDEDYPCGGGGGSGGGGGGGGGGNTSNGIGDGTNVNYRINKMTVRHHNESWLAGQSEVRIRAWMNYHNGRYNGDPAAPFQDYSTEASSTDECGVLIKNVKRKDIKNWVENTVNFTLKTNWTLNIFSSTPVIFQYCIFERDLWPVGIRTASHYPYYGESAYAGQAAFFVYRSQDNEYLTNSFYANKSGMLINIPQTGGNKTYNNNDYMTESREDVEGIKINIQNY